MQFAFAPDGIDQPLLAAIALVTFASASVLLWLWSSTRAANTPQGLMHVALLLIAVSSIAWLSGSAASGMLAMYGLPIAAASIAFARWWTTLLTALVAVGCAYLLNALTLGVELHSIDFAVRLLAQLLPSAVVAVILAIEIDRGRRAARHIRDLATTDALTGVLNIRAFESALQQAHGYAERRGASYSILMIDVDNLSHINESAGHEAGSLVLNAVAAAIVRSVRRSDVVARFGGDEFIALCTHATPETAAAIAQRIRNNVYASTVSAGHRLIRANVSVGVVNYPEDRLHPKDLLMLASHRMQQDRELRKDTPASQHSA
jgi:diguanylate cyclase (GGDEF)-like protein